MGGRATPWLPLQWPLRASEPILSRRLSSPAMLATYGSFLVILAASCLVGQGVFALCGRRQWSWLAPAVGLSVLTAVAWGTVRLPGEGSRVVDRNRRPDARLPGLPDRARRRSRRLGAGGPARGGAGSARRVASLPRRAALRDPRHRPQSGYVSASVRGRPARARRGRQAPQSGLPARSTCPGGGRVERHRRPASSTASTG